MKNMFVKWLSALLIACLVLSSGAIMEELPADENAMAMEIVDSEPSDETTADAVPAEDEVSDPVDEVPTEAEASDPTDEVSCAEEEIAVDAAEEVVEEQQDVDLRAPETYEAQAFIGDAEGGLLMEGSTGIAIDESHFPDEHFRNYISKKADKNSDGSLSQDEINTVTGLECVSKCITAKIMQEEYGCKPDGRRTGSGKRVYRSG